MFGHIHEALNAVEKTTNESKKTSRPRLVAGCKVFEIESFHILSTKYRLIIKLIT